eukprot:GEMP01018566.1.p1 GENE.GEMP01018566.1~~GEMP01018566.1.p1  ORF type:complete len:437 (+),score=88.96 GEMP01018566.1:181-1491(+)
MFRLVQWNILKEELCQNFNLRTMRPILIDSLPLKDPTKAATVIAKLLAEDQGGTGEYSHKQNGWHTLGKHKVHINGESQHLRSLWAARDLSTCTIDAANVTVLSPTKLKLDNTVLRTLRGVLLDEIGAGDADVLYDHIEQVHNEYFSWQIRGQRILEKILNLRADIAVIEENDVHFGPRSPFPGIPDATFSEAMTSHGYRGLLFDGCLAQHEGIGIFWRTDAFSLDEDVDTVVPIGEYSASKSVLNVAFQAKEKSGQPLPDRLRRHFAVVCLTHKATGNKLRVCGVHISPTSRDDAEGTIRSQELCEAVNALSRTPADATILAGDFNINLRSLEEEHILNRVPGYEVVNGKRRFRFPGQPDEFTLEDAFGDIDGGNDVATSYTTTRNEMIDYVFHAPRQLEVSWRSELKCPEIPMPNSEEPSDHIPLAVEFRWRTE